MDESIELGRLNGVLSSLEKVIERINDSLYDSNGGAMTRLTKTEETLQHLIESTEAQSENISQISKSIGDLKNVVETHVTDKTQHSVISQVMTNKKIIFLFTLGFIVLHYLWENLPNVWLGLIKLIGF